MFFRSYFLCLDVSSFPASSSSERDALDKTPSSKLPFSKRSESSSESLIPYSPQLPPHQPPATLPQLALAELKQLFQIQSVRKQLIANADEIVCGESIRFLAAIFDFEDIGDKRNKRATAFKLIASFVESGAKYENNMSSRIRDELIAAKGAGKWQDAMFEPVKLEVMRDILQNPSLKQVLKLKCLSKSYPHVNSIASNA